MHKSHLIFTIMAATTFIPASATAQSDDNNTEIYSEFSTLLYSENFTLETFISTLENETDFTNNGRASFTLNKGEFGIRHRNWELGVFTRYDYLIEYTPDTAEVYYAGDNGDDIRVENGRYDIDLSANHSFHYGASLGYTYELTPKIDVSAKLNAFLSESIVKGRIQGFLLLNDEEVEEGELLLDYVYTDDLVFERDVNQPTGIGWSTDIEVNWRPRDDWQVTAKAVDAFSQIYWKDLTHMRADATTAIVRTDNNGLLIVRPTLRGIILEENYKQKLERQFYGSIQHDLNHNWTVRQDIFSYGRTQLAHANIIRHIGDDFTIRGEAEWLEGAGGLWLGWRGIEAGVTTSHLNPRKAHYIKAGIGLKHSF